MNTQNRITTVLTLAVVAMTLLGSVVNGGVIGLIGDEANTTVPWGSTCTKAENLLGATNDPFAYDPGSPTSVFPEDYDGSQCNAFVGRGAGGGELAVIAYDFADTDIYDNIFVHLYGRRTTCCPERDDYFDVELYLGGILQETIAGSIVAGYYDLVTASPGTQADAIRIVETAASPNFFTLLEIRVNGEVSISPVHAGVDMITWSGQGVGLVPSYDFGYTPTSLAWSASPTTGVVFDPAGADPWTSTVETPTVTITKATDNPSTVNLTFTADDGGGPVVDTMRIYVYDDACLAAIVADPVAAIDVTDFDGNCITGLEDFAVAALAWFYDFSLTEPVAK